MLTRLLQRLRPNEKAEVPRISHPVLGPLCFNAHAGQWESPAQQPVHFGGIPGDFEGPAPGAIGELLSRLESVDLYRNRCNDDLMHVARTLASVSAEADTCETWELAGLSLDGDEWEIVFRTRPHLRAVEMAIRFEGETPVSNSIDT